MVTLLQCNAACSRQGKKYRTVRCVWYGTSRQVHNGCRNMTRPAIIKDCKGPPCAENCKYCEFISDDFYRFSVICVRFFYFFYYVHSFLFFFPKIFFSFSFVTQNNKVHCKDSSRYCTNVLSMGLCKLHRYQLKCCRSCRFKLNAINKQ